MPFLSSGKVRLRRFSIGVGKTRVIPRPRTFERHGARIGHEMSATSGSGSIALPERASTSCAWWGERGAGVCYATAVADDPGGPGGSRNRRVTRDVEVSALRDLLDHPLRATVAFVDGGAVALLPARVRDDAGAYRFGILADGAANLDTREVVLVVDDGCYWFELRGVSVRGMAVRIEASTGAGADRLAWYAIEPRRVLAWDYAAIREA